jgi:hypothetical protein
MSEQWFKFYKFLGGTPAKIYSESTPKNPLPWWERVG